jgi:hypothetical protein
VYEDVGCDQTVEWRLRQRLRGEHFLGITDNDPVQPTFSLWGVVGVVFDTHHARILALLDRRTKCPRGATEFEDVCRGRRHVGGDIGAGRLVAGLARCAEFLGSAVHEGRVAQHRRVC